MRRSVGVALNLLWLGTGVFAASAQSTRDYAVEVSVRVQEDPPQITLVWPKDSSVPPESYTVYRRGPVNEESRLAEWWSSEENGKKTGWRLAPSSAEASGLTPTSLPQAGARKPLLETGWKPALWGWGAGLELPGSATSFVDRDVKAGTAYEYQVVRNTAHFDGYGYIYAGIDVPLTENRGRLLLVVDRTYAADLAPELQRLEQDLVGDGWTVKRLDVGRGDSVPSVKSLIRGEYERDPINTKSVFLFGHVPVPYSGDIVPDGHAPDHEGAWPCDGYYGDMDGEWTDTVVNDTRARDARNRNVPGDGKFDQSYFPAPLKLMVGRVDLANMPGRLCEDGPATFPSELELLRNYLNKDHKFRTRQFELPRRAIVGDYFGCRDGEAFAASAWRNFASFFTAANVTRLPEVGTWIPTLHSNAYLWAYGCGNGTYTSIEGLGNTAPYHDGITPELVNSDIQAVFTMLFGSWLGDWDSEDNIQRSVLALPSYSLTCALSGRPHWFLHHMALGEPIGFSTRLTQNNSAHGPYRNEVNSCAGQIHIALMGDPTLRLHPVAPPTDVKGARDADGFVLSWRASEDTVAGYHVYRAPSAGGPYTRLTSSMISNTSFVDKTDRRDGCPAAYYMVRAIKLEASASGTYYNPSQGAFYAPNSDTVSAPAPAKEAKTKESEVRPFTQEKGQTSTWPTANQRFGLIGQANWPHH